MAKKKDEILQPAEDVNLKKETPEDGAQQQDPPEDGAQQQDPPEDGAQQQDPPKRELYVVNYPNGLNLRAGPGREHAVLDVLPFEQEVLCTDNPVAAGDTTWLPCIDGWVDSRYLTRIE